MCTFDVPPLARSHLTHAHTPRSHARLLRGRSTWIVPSSYVAEFAHLGATIPVERVYVRIQTGRDNNASDAVASIVREEGVAGLWAGWSAYFVLALKPAIEYAVYEQVGALYHSLHDCC